MGTLEMHISLSCRDLCAGWSGLQMAEYKMAELPYVTSWILLLAYQKPHDFFLLQFSPTHIHTQSEAFEQRSYSVSNSSAPDQFSKLFFPFSKIIYISFPALVPLALVLFS